MFANACRPDSSTDEGVVGSVDILRQCCKVKTISGHTLDGVRWTSLVGGSSRGGDRSNPATGDNVVLEYGLGYPLITKFLPKIQSSDNTFPVDIDSGSQLVDTGNYSGSSSTTSDANKPGDILSGDRVLSSEGGAVVALLRAGSVLLRSSRLSQILICKLDDVIKIISRNFEQYTDVSSDIVKNLKGRVYRYIGYTNNMTDSRNEDYKYHQYFGDVSMAEKVKTNYLSPPTIPNTGPLIYKEQVTDGSEKMYRSLNLSGEEVLQVTDGTYSRRTTNASTTIITFNGENTITVNSPVIELKRADGAVITLNASGVHLEFQGAKTDLLSDGIFNEYNGHFVNITSSGVQLG